MMGISGLLTVACLFLFCVPSCGLNVHCFYTNWAQYRSGAARFTVSNINASLCTHIFYGFAKLDGNNVVEYEYNDKDMWRQFNALKQSNPRLKTFLSVGGYTLGHDPYAKMVSSQGNRSAFINSVVSILRTYGFDGLDIDWEYPVATDKQNFKILTQEMASVFEMEGKNTSRPRLQLTLSVPAGISTIDNGYDISGMNSYVDYWNVMGYDYHGSWERSTNLPTPLNDQGDKLSVSSTVDHYLTHGASTEKVILGLAFYARTWAVSGSSSSIGSPATGPGAAGTYTKTAGILAYYEVCDLIRNTGLTVQYESTYGYLNYGAKNGIWVGYEALNSLEEKMKFIERKSLGGAMIWTLDFDDFLGQFCGQDKYPLTRFVSSRMLSISTNVSTTTITTTRASNTTTANTTTTNTTPTTITTTSTSTSTSNVSSAVNSTVCSTKYGFFPDTGNCSYYLVCENGTVTRRIKCVPDTIFNPNSKKCENLANTTYICPNQTSAITTTATTTSTTAAILNVSTTASIATSSTTASTTTASTTAPTTTASTTAPTTTTTASTTTGSTSAPTTTGSTSAPTTTGSTSAPTTTGSTSAPTTTASTTTVLTTLSPTSTAAVTPKSQNTTQVCDFTCPKKVGIFANRDCTIYNVCSDWRATCIHCPSGQIYNPEKTKCERVSQTTYKCPS